MNNTIGIFGCGWLGLPLGKALLQQGYRVKGSTTSIARLDELQQAGIQPHIASLQDSATDLAELLNCDTLVLAMPVKDVEAFARLATLIAESPVQRVLYISSTSVYPFTNQTVTEHDGVELPESPLFQIEQLLRQSPGFKTTVVRMAGLIDERRHPGRFFQNKAIPSADACVNLIHRDDCIGLILAIIQQQAWDDVFNGCAPSHPSKREFYGYAASQLGLATPKERPTTSPDDHSPFKRISGDYARRRLGYEFQHPDLMKIQF